MITMTVGKVGRGGMTRADFRKLLRRVRKEGGHITVGEDQHEAMATALQYYYQPFPEPRGMEGYSAAQRKERAEWYARLCLKYGVAPDALRELPHELLNLTTEEQVRLGILRPCDLCGELESAEDLTWCRVCGRNVCPSCDAGPRVCRECAPPLAQKYRLCSCLFDEEIGGRPCRRRNRWAHESRVEKELEKAIRAEKIARWEIKARERELCTANS